MYLVRLNLKNIRFGQLGTLKSKGKSYKTEIKGERKFEGHTEGTLYIKSFNNFFALLFKELRGEGEYHNHYVIGNRKHKLSLREIRKKLSVILMMKGSL